MCLLATDIHWMHIIGNWHKLNVSPWQLTSNKCVSWQLIPVEFVFQKLTSIECIFLATDTNWICLIINWQPLNVSLGNWNWFLLGNWHQMNYLLGNLHQLHVFPWQMTLIECVSGQLMPNECVFLATDKFVIVSLCNWDPSNMSSLQLGNW